MKALEKMLLVWLIAVGLACTTGASSPEDATAPAPEHAAAPAPEPPVEAAQNGTARGAATKAFLDRINEYVDFHNNVEKMVPPLTETSDPNKIAAREKALGEQLIKSRPNAKPGDFFITQYQPYLADIIKADFGKRPLADRKALIQELPKGFKIDVNTVYPTTLPLMTFPGKLLRALPELPPELEYRIVGRHLILRDVKANVIVDIMPNVFPIPM
jgi:hypothetical protein